VRPRDPSVLLALLLSAATLAGSLGALQRRGPPPAADDDGETPAVFRRFAARVPKLQVVEVRSGAKQVTGSAFFVTGDGLAITNYHVVSDLVRDPDKYRAELLEPGGGARPVRVVAVDVVHDLAVLRTGAAPAGWFRLAPVSVAQGRRLYALGHPGDLGIAIVEGTFNGLLPHTLYPRIHFTGSINPGMSGGPTITLDGRVVGINVATAGNQQSFLVPADDAIALLDRAGRAEPPPAESLLAEVGRQLLAYQDTYLGRLFADAVPTVRLGAWALPTRPTDIFNCWGETDDDPEQPYTITHHYCSTGDDIFLSADHSSGIIEFEHDLIESDELGAFRFATLYTRELRALSLAWGLDRRGDEEVTGDRCRARNVRLGTVRAKAILCLRAYKRLPGLYDVVFRLATLGGRRSGVITTLTLSGVSYANAERVVRRYAGHVGWAP
jgi:serine protease Do